MGIQNADDALRTIVNALDDVPPVLRETLKNKKRQEIEESFFSSYFDKNPEYRIEVPTPTIGNNAEYARALAKDKAVKQKILEQTRTRIQAKAGEAANRKFVGLGYSEDLPNARDLAKDLYHEEILNSPLPYISSRWQPTIYQDEIPQIQVRPQTTPQEVPRTAAPIPTNNEAIAPEDVIATQPGMTTPEIILEGDGLGVVGANGFPAPQYKGVPRPQDIPLSGVNDEVNNPNNPGAVSTASGIPGGGNYNYGGEGFDIPDTSNYPNIRVPQRETPGQPRIPGLLEQVYDTGNKWKNTAQGAWAGFVNNIEGGRSGRAQSVFPRVAQVINDQDFQARTVEGKVGQAVGEGTADWMGNGTRQNLWNAFPPDFVATHAAGWLGNDASRVAKVVIPFAAVTGLELGSQTYNPFNLGQGGRVAGYAAINPDEDDPRISTTPVSELLIDRGFLGKRGRLLPWEQFRQERTDIPYEQYEKYQDYLRNKDDNALRDMTGGLIKGTLDGINGPELSVMGYSVTPTGALAAGAALLAGRELVRTGRIAGFRK
jgi:hypothetical protein